jgi:hypothetical protein
VLRELMAVSPREAAILMSGEGIGRPVVERRPQAA